LVSKFVTIGDSLRVSERSEIFSIGFPENGIFSECIPPIPPVFLIDKFNWILEKAKKDIIGFIFEVVIYG
jgi:hypothetical protein